MGRTIILGAGLAGLSASYHLGHGNCLLLERNSHPYGHIKSETGGGFTWDEGPHVSFTRHDYVKQLFAESVRGEFEQFEVKLGNYYRGHWIDHPAQIALFQVPEPLRAQCLESFRKSRRTAPEQLQPPSDYQEWIERAFGQVFANTFPAAYTRKYWTREPRDLGVDWLGGRVHYPTIEDVEVGAVGPLGRKTNYITTVRYPRQGGYESFAHKLAAGANIQCSATVVKVDLQARTVRLSSGAVHAFDRLVCTLPLPVFVGLCAEVPTAVREAASALECSQLLLVNITAAHAARRPETWFYVYDEDKLSTRINFTEHMAQGNAPTNTTGIQTEVYASRSRPFPHDRDKLAALVQQELADMGLIEPAAVTSVQTVSVPWANVIFHHQTKPALAVIWNWLERYGLTRETDDLHPLTEWGAKDSEQVALGALAFAGRFGQWKYYWTDDCVLRGRCLARFAS